MVLTSTITCPFCGFEQAESMPENACESTRDIHFGGTRMAAAFSRERARTIVLVLLGLATFGAASVPVVQSILHPPRCTAGAMLNSVLATLGVFLVLAARNPSAYRSLIIFGAWSSFAHAAVMALMAIQVTAQRTELLIPAALGGIAGVLLLVLVPEKQTAVPIS